MPLFLDEGSLLLVFSRVGELDECKAGDPYAEQAQDVSWFDLSHNRERCGADPHGEGDCFEDELRQRPPALLRVVVSRIEALASSSSSTEVPSCSASKGSDAVSGKERLRSMAL